MSGCEGAQFPVTSSRVGRSAFGMDSLTAFGSWYLLLCVCHGLEYITMIYTTPSVIGGSRTAP